MPGAVENPLDHHGVFTKGMENQVAAVHGKTDARAVFLSQRVSLGLPRHGLAMHLQLRDEAQGATWISGGNEERDILQIGLGEKREPAGVRHLSPPCS